MKQQRPSSEDLVKTIFAAALDKKATDVVSLHMEPLITITDYFVIATGANDRQLTAIVDEIERRVRTEHQVHPTAHEGTRGANWIVLDYVDVVVHVFLQDARNEYRLEKLWSEAAQMRATEADSSLDNGLVEKVTPPLVSLRTSESEQSNPDAPSAEDALTVGSPGEING